MRESLMWKRLEPIFPGSVRIEAKIPDGLPDVCANLGGGRVAWIELKQAQVKKTSLGLLWWIAPRLTLEQAIYLKKWKEQGGLAGVLLSYGDTFAYVNDGFRELRKTYVDAAWVGRLPADRDTLRAVIDPI